jgi:hypothetical protein
MSLLLSLISVTRCQLINYGTSLFRIPRACVDRNVVAGALS